MKARGVIAHPPKAFKKYGDDFLLITAMGNGFIYARRGLKWDNKTPMDTIYYEAFKKQVEHHPHPKSKSKVRRYRYPNNEDFGKFAICTRSLEKAYQYLK